jgi:hypothetical protein
MKSIINRIALACCFLMVGSVYGDSWQQMPSFSGDCGAKPAGTMCFRYEDGYIWLVRGGNLRSEKRVEGGQTIQVMIATTGRRYQHILGTNYVLCASSNCDRIDVPPAQEMSKVFNNPTIDGFALDYCREWEANCGSPAAYAYCYKKGYLKAVTFSYRKGPPTKVINGGQVCNQPFCDRITSVTCADQRID